MDTEQLKQWKDPRLAQPAHGQACWFMVRATGNIWSGNWYRYEVLDENNKVIKLGTFYANTIEVEHKPGMIATLSTKPPTGPGFHVWVSNDYEVSAWQPYFTPKPPEACGKNQ